MHLDPPWPRLAYIIHGKNGTIFHKMLYNLNGFFKILLNALDKVQFVLFWMYFGSCNEYLRHVQGLKICKIGKIRLIFTVNTNFLQKL